MRRQPLQHSQPESSAPDAAAGEAEGRLFPRVQARHQDLPEGRLGRLVIRLGGTVLKFPGILAELALFPKVLQGAGVLGIAAVLWISRRIRAAPVFFAQNFPHRQGFRLVGGHPSKQSAQEFGTRAGPHNHTSGD